MKPQILVTDLTFIFEEHIQQIEKSGYEVVRLVSPKASEDQLIEALKGKVGYILGGIETVTEKVIRSTSGLKVISFTGSGYAGFIPGHKAAREMGIAISVAKGANADAVAEFSITLCLFATRQLSQLTHPIGPEALTAKGATESTLGIIGYGGIGRKVVALATKLGYSVLVAARNRIDSLPPNVRQVDIKTLVVESDVISLHVDEENGPNVLNKELVNLMPSGSAIVNAAFIDAMDREAVAKRIESKEIRLFTDQKLGIVGNYDPGMLVETNSQSGFHTFQSLKVTSDRTTNSLLNILETGEDEYRVI